MTFLSSECTKQPLVVVHHLWCWQSGTNNWTLQAFYSQPCPVICVILPAHDDRQQAKCDKCDMLCLVHVPNDFNNLKVVNYVLYIFAAVSCHSWMCAIKAFYHFHDFHYNCKHLITKSYLNPSIWMLLHGCVIVVELFFNVHDIGHVGPVPQSNVLDWVRVRWQGQVLQWSLVASEENSRRCYSKTLWGNNTFGKYDMHVYYNDDLVAPIFIILSRVWSQVVDL